MKTDNLIHNWGMNSGWHVGQKVICIHGSFPRNIVEWCNSVPVAGQIYTIRALQLGSEPTTGYCDIGFLLAEITNPRKANGAESGFFHTRFVAWMDADSNVEHDVAVEALC